MNYSTFYTNLKHAAAAVLVSMAVAGCRSEGGEAAFDSDGTPVAFGALLTNEADLRTRTLEREPLNPKFYSMDFFLQLCYEDQSDHTTGSEMGTYVIPSGYSGWLESKESRERLNWHDLKSDHTFYAWNLPWTTESYEELAAKSDLPDTDDEGNVCPLRPLRIEFHDSPETEKESGSGYDKFRNDSIMQYFIGAKTGPVSYQQNGTYVELVFRHLVSKIHIAKLSLIEGPHTIQNDLKADMTFFGMPYTGVFYPHPANNGAPLVVADEPTDEQVEKGRTYFISNDPDRLVDNIFYVAPELDFSKLSFKIKITDTRYEGLDAYYGNFNNVNFVRVAGEDYDRGGDEKVLHAGEVMHLVIELYKGMGPGLAVVIDDWSTEKSNDAVHHYYPGIYSDGEAQELADFFRGTYTDDQLQNLLDRYADREDPTRFNLYENVTVSGSSFPLGREYELNGLGHTITMKPSNNSVTIGRMRDVYITDGTNTIWIDENGKIWKLNTKTNEFEETGNTLPDNFDNGKSSFQINLTTGQVTQK